MLRIASVFWRTGFTYIFADDETEEQQLLPKLTPSSFKLHAGFVELSERVFQMLGVFTLRGV